MHREEGLRTWQTEERGEAAELSLPDQLTSLMDRFEAPLYKFLMALVGSHDVAQDCTQDTFMRAYENLRKGKPVTAAWLYTVARNRAMDTFRRRKRERPDQAELERVPTSGGTDAVALRDAFAHLPPDDRTVLYLLAVEGLHPGEIATVLGINANAVRMRIFRARQRLKLAYGAWP